MIKPNKQIYRLNPYVPGMPIDELARKYGFDPNSIIKLASNENSLGHSRNVASAIKAEINNINRYPDQQSLLRVIADHHKVGKDNLVLGNGSNDIIDLVARTYLNEKDESISSQYGFIIYQLVSTIASATNIVVPAKDYGHDLAAMKAAINDKTKVIWIANPNNPTGTFIPYSEITEFLEGVPSHIIVVLDEAYYEYLDDKLQIQSSELLNKYQNLIILRTFSKIYGIAGLRIGYCLASVEISNFLNAVRHPFNINSLALVAAEAALDDQEHVTRCREHNLRARHQLESGLKAMNISLMPSYANFVTAKFENTDKVYLNLLQKGIITRQLKEYGLDNHLRISIGTEQEVNSILTTLDNILTS